MVVVTNVLKRRRGTWLEVFASDLGSIRLPAEHAPPGIAPGTRLEPAEWDALAAASAYHVLYDKALRLLGSREHFAAELRRKLAQRTPDRELIARVLSACEQRGYLSDERAAEYTTQRLLARGGIGRGKLKSELYARGASAALIERMLELHGGEVDEGAACAELLERRRAHFAGKLSRMREKLENRPDFNPRKARMLLRPKLGALIGGFIHARGFTEDDARRAGRKLVDELLEAEFGD